VIYGRGGISAGGVFLKKLKWRDWGHARAKAKGIECGFRLPCQNIKAKVRAWRPRERCGKRVYTRLEATTRFGHSRADVQGCPGPAFKAVATPSHPKGASGKPKIACWNQTFPTEQGTEDPQSYREPRKCIIFKRGAVSYAEGVVRAYKLRWKNWGHRRAVGKGKMFISTAGFFPVKIRLSKPRMSCGRLVFSMIRYRIKNFNGDDFGGRFHPYTC
jgi:hypothetical protein